MPSPQEKIDGAVDRQREDRRALLARFEHPGMLTMLRKVATSRDAAALARVAYNACVKNEQLLRCTVDSLLASTIEAAQLGLSVDGVLGHAYLVPYFNRGRQVAQMQIGYRGYCALAYRSDKVVSISASEVCEHDMFDYQEGTQAFLRHTKPLTEDRGKVIGAFAVARLAGGGEVFRVIRRDEIESRRDRSPAYKAFLDGKIKSTPWDTDPEPMIRKTAIRALAPWLPVEQLQRAAAREEARDAGAAEAPQSPDEIVIGEDGVIGGQT